MSLLRQAVAPKSDQLNADDLIGTTKTITVTGVRVVMGDQPVTINYEGDNGKPYKPAKTMTRLLIFAWGDDETKWVGKSMTLYCDPDVTFGRDRVGGIRISHLSDIRGDMEVSITKTRGRRAPYKVRKLNLNNTSPASMWADRLREASLTGQMAELVRVWNEVPRDLKPSLEDEKDACKEAVEKMAGAHKGSNGGTYKDQDFKPAQAAMENKNDAESASAREGNVDESGGANTDEAVGGNPEEKNEKGTSEVGIEDF